MPPTLFVHLGANWVCDEMRLKMRTGSQCSERQNEALAVLIYLRARLVLSFWATVAVTEQRKCVVATSRAKTWVQLAKERDQFVNKNDKYFLHWFQCMWYTCEFLLLNSQSFSWKILVRVLSKRIEIYIQFILDCFLAHQGKSTGIEIVDKKYCTSKSPHWVQIWMFFLDFWPKQQKWWLGLYDSLSCLIKRNRLMMISSL